MSLWTNVNSVDDIWQQQPVDCCHQHQHYREDIKKKTYSSCAQRQSGHFNRPKGDKVRVDKRETQRERESEIERDRERDREWVSEGVKERERERAATVSPKAALTLGHGCSSSAAMELHRSLGCVLIGVYLWVTFYCQGESRRRSAGPWRIYVSLTGAAWSSVRRVRAVAPVTLSDFGCASLRIWSDRNVRAVKVGRGEWSVCEMTLQKFLVCVVLISCTTLLHMCSVFSLLDTQHLSRTKEVDARGPFLSLQCNLQLKHCSVRASVQRIFIQDSMRRLNLYMCWRGCVFTHSVCSFLYH